MQCDRTVVSVSRACVNSGVIVMEATDICNGWPTN